MRRGLSRVGLVLFAGASAIAAPPNLESPQSILDLQPFSQSSSMRMRSKAGRDGTASLTDLNSGIHGWYLLTVAWAGAPGVSYHLENPDPRGRRILLDEKYPSGIVIADGKSRYACDLFRTDALEQAKASPVSYAPLCEGRIYLRNPASGHRSSLEAATEFLREHVWGGEEIIGLGHILMGDAHRETGELGTGTRPAISSPSELPLPATIDSKFADRALQSYNLGIDLEGPGRTGMSPGAWYPVNGNPGVYVSLVQPNLIDPTLLQSYRNRVNALDGAEASALVYSIAFDLDRFELGFSLGTEHPKVGWSDQVLPNMKNPAWAGPDGIGSISPLVATGLISPANASKVAATFAGGFKRTHGAFKYGDLALKNHGSHYGFIEDGVVLSTLQPGLATIAILDDGTVRMKTWTDNTLLPRIKYARQNGVPLIDFDESSQSPAPGPLVNRWGAGNWSGSEEKKLRTMRAGAAMQRNNGKTFLIYAVFSDATPSAMARVFQAYHCEYAMLLDMNALEHTYMALYRRSGKQLYVDHLLKGMNVLEKSAPSGEIVPRFLGYADNRDFFYVMRR